MPEVLIIGGGLFGSVIRDALRASGVHAQVLDDKRHGGGSRPAACLMKPSWFSSLGPGVYNPSLELLDSLYQVKEIPFQIHPSKMMTNVKWVDPRKILTPVDHHALLTGAHWEDGRWRVMALEISDSVDPPGAPIMLFCKHLIVCGGVWTNEILKTLTPRVGPVEGLSPREGVAFLFAGEIEQPFISLWAPYRQLVAFNRAPRQLWVGDGTAVKQLSEAGLTSSRDRCMTAVGRWSGAVGIKGARPYVKGVKPCFQQRIPGFNLHIVTGGAKNGTIAAGWAAHKIVEDMCQQ